MGYCGNNNLKCWLDSQSVKNAIDFRNLEENVLNVTNANAQSILRSEGGYLTEEDFKSEIEKIRNTNLNVNKINLINEIIDKVFFNSEKASLLYLRGNAYAGIAIKLYTGLSLKCDTIGEEECRGTQIWHCSHENLWYKFVDCGDKNKLCTTYGTDRAECITSEEASEILGTEFLDSKDLSLLEYFESTVFEFQDRKIRENICYKYLSGTWHWTKDCGKIGSVKTKRSIVAGPASSVTSTSFTYKWIPVTSLKNPYGGEPNQENLDIIEGLQDKDFNNGLYELINKIVASRNSRLVAENNLTQSTLFNIKTIEIEYKDKNKEYYRYKGAKWEYSVNNKYWKLLPVDHFLLGKDFVIGTKILLLGIDKNQAKDLEFTYNQGEVIGEKEDKEEVENMLEEIKQEWGWSNWEDVIESFKTLMWSKIEKNMVLNAKTCNDCGNGIGFCNEAECIAIGFKLRDDLNQGKICEHNPPWGCEEVLLGETITATGSIPSGETCEPVEVSEAVKSISTARLKVLKMSEELNGQIVVENVDCYTAARYVYEKAEIEPVCLYSDKVGKTYPIPLNNIIIETEDASNDPYPLFAVNEGCQLVGKDENRKLNYLAEGYFISYYYGITSRYPEGVGHNAVFIKWENQNTRYAQIFDWSGPRLTEGKKDSVGKICTPSDFKPGESYCKTYWYTYEYLKDDNHPVYMIWKPVSFEGGSFGGAGAGGDY